MVHNSLLTSIWSGKIEVRYGEDMSPLATLLSSILTVPTVSLVVESDIKRPVAFADSVELMPGLPLGDVLTEELGFDVPVNCVILIEPASVVDSTEFSAAELGRDLGRVLTSVAGKTEQDAEEAEYAFFADSKSRSNLSLRAS